MTAGDIKRIVIVGGGFAGADLARSLSKTLPRGWDVTLFSRENHFVFTPLLAEVVGAAINPLHVIWPVREMARGISCRTVPVVDFDFENTAVVYLGPDGEEQREQYTHLVLACGLAVNLDIVPGMAKYGWPVKTLGDALALRNHILERLELAEAETDDARRSRLLSFAVVGGGFTGIELAGSIMDLLQESCRFYNRFSERDLRVTVVDGGPRILGPLPEELAAYAAAELRKQGIRIESSVSVKEVRADGIVTGDGDGDYVEASTVISAVGNAPQPLLAASGLPMQRGRLTVDAGMRVEGRDDVWALGDCAAVPNAFDGSISPTLGQFAIRQAAQLAKNLVSVIGGGRPAPFSYHSQGMLAAIGHRNAVGNPLGVRITGFLAYVMWRGIYWMKMPSLARKFQIAFDWTWDLFFKRDIVEFTTTRTPRTARAHFAAGETVYRRGDAGDRLFIIEQGVAGVYTEGDTVPVKLVAGDHFGEESLMHASPRSKSVRAEEPLDVVMIDRETFARMDENIRELVDELDRRRAAATRE